MKLRISSEDERMIKDDMIQWYDRSRLMKQLSNFTLVITTDFTANSSGKGDFSGVAAWAIGADNDWFLLDLDLKKRTIQEQYDALFRMVAKYSKAGRVIEVGVEIDGQQQLNVFALKQMMIDKNVWFRFAKQKGVGYGQEGIRSRSASGSKFERLKYVMPTFEKKKFWLPEDLKTTPDMKEMLEELKYVTYLGIGSRHDDGLDLISQVGMIDYILPSMGSLDADDELTRADAAIWGKTWDDDESSGSSVIF